MRLIVGNIYQGKGKYAKKKYGEKASMKRLSMETVDELLKAGVSSVGIANKLMEYDIVIADESFEGLTPVSYETRDLAEIYGELLQKLAEQAESVEKIVCGLPIVLK